VRHITLFVTLTDVPSAVFANMWADSQTGIMVKDWMGFSEESVAEENGDHYWVRCHVRSTSY